jgi:hypothetical protein
MKGNCSGVYVILRSLLGTNLFLRDFLYARKIKLNILLTSQIYSYSPGHRHIRIPQGGLRTAPICYRRYDDCSHTHFLVDTAYNAMKI